MSDMKKFLRDVGYFGVGAASVIVEAGSKVVRTLVGKGEKTLRDNQETVDDIKRKAKDAGDRIVDAARKAIPKPDSGAEKQTGAEEAPAGCDTIDAATMTAEERAELRRQLDEADAAGNAESDQSGNADEADEAQPAAPDATYHSCCAAPDAESAETAPAKDPWKDNTNG